jgi:hypothetical protein
MASPVLFPLIQNNPTKTENIGTKQAITLRQQTKVTLEDSLIVALRDDSLWTANGKNFERREVLQIYVS